MWEIQPERSEKWYEHAPEGVVENKEVKILWDVMIQCDTEIKTRKSDIVVVNKNERSCAIMVLLYLETSELMKKRRKKLRDTSN